MCVRVRVRVRVKVRARARARARVRVSREVTGLVTLFSVFFFCCCVSTAEVETSVIQ